MTDPLKESIDSGEVVDDRYTVVNRIGSGGMADVYCAQDSQLGRRVALKVLHRRFASDTEFVERFRREASAAAGLQHPNVVQVFDRGELDGTYYIAMEFLEGRDLKSLVREEGALDPQRAIEITIQVLWAARFAHKRGIIHRDFKPHNVIVDTEGRVKVTDFGIARAGASDMTETGAIMGTAAYLSPEQAQGHAVSASSDLYSVGILLYELLTGAPPFNAESAVSIALKQVSESPAPPRSINPAVSPELEDVVLRALQKDPSQRFADADEFIAALEAVREYPARPDLGQRTGDLTGVYPALGLYSEEVEESRRRRGWRFWTMVLLVLLALAAIGVGLFLLLKPEQVDVPKVVGQTSRVASTRLTNLGFKVQLTQLRNPDVPEDIVSRQLPGPGKKADKGSTVTIYVSSGPGQATVPDVVGKSEASARKAIEKAGFKTRVKHAYSETAKAGKVVDTEPSAQTQIDLGKAVTLVVSKGPEEATIPKVVGLDQAEATAQLQDAGFEVATATKESEEDPGTVIASSPEAGQELRKGETVTLTIAKEPAEVDVPDVAGDSVNQAVRELADAGLVARQRKKTVTVPDEDGQVLSQTPTSGKLKKGATVTIVVGAFDDSSLDPEPDDTETPTPTPSPSPTPVP